jgi:hypothetical protein
LAGLQQAGVGLVGVAGLEGVAVGYLGELAPSVVGAALPEGLVAGG